MTCALGKTGVTKAKGEETVLRDGTGKLCSRWHWSLDLNNRLYYSWEGKQRGKEHYIPKQAGTGAKGEKQRRSGRALSTSGGQSGFGPFTTREGFGRVKKPATEQQSVMHVWDTGPLLASCFDQS